MKFCYLVLFYSFTLIFLNSCAVSDTRPGVLHKAESYQDIAEAKYNENIEYIFNADTSYVLCIKQFKPTNQTPFLKLNFFVYLLKSMQIVFEESLGRGHVKWLNNHQLQVFLIPGIIKGDEKQSQKFYGYIYDLVHHKKIYNSNPVDQKK